MFEKDDQEYSRIIEAGLEEVLSGKASVDEVVSRHPSLAAVLRPELEAAIWLVSKREQVQTRPGYLAASKTRLTRRIKQEASQRGAKRALFGFNWWTARFSAMRWTAAILIVIIFFSMSGGVVSAAQDSIPGQELYPVKRLSEQVVFDLTIDIIQKVELSNHFAERRFSEFEALIQRSDFALAVQTLEAFQIQVKMTVDLLDKVDEGNFKVKLALADKVNSDMVRRGDRLQVLMASVPLELQLEITTAREVITISASIADEISDRIKEQHQLATDTPTPTQTLLTTSPTASPTLFRTATPIIVVVTPVPASVGNEDDAEGDKKIFATPERRDIKPGLTKTARPANENKPPKDDKDSRPPKSP